MRMDIGGEQDKAAGSRVEQATSRSSIQRTQQSNPGRDAAVIRVLLSSGHQPTLQVLTAAMRSLPVMIETCQVAGAFTKLCKAKYEGVFVDLREGEEALELLRNLRTLTSNKGAVCCAVLNHRSETAAAFQAGANFVLERPLQPDLVVRTVEAGYPMMLLERRRYFRCSLQVPARLTRRQDGSKHAAESINLSEGGMAINSSLQLHPGETLGLEFQLPGDRTVVSVSGQVCWSQAPGRSGVQFTEVTRHTAEQLQKWLSERLHELLPDTPKS